jgi:predicted Ser/Thr protein kinase
MKLEIGYCLDGSYILLSEIGRGGQGLVYKAKHLAMDKFVAIKMLPDALVGNNDTIMRFQREAKLLASLEHPNIVSAKAFGISQNQMPYLVMEFVEGTSLSDLIDQQERLPFETAIELFQDICHALEFVHQKGIIHRDIKPGNIIIVTTETGRLSAKLIDFGTGRLTQLSEGLQKITATGTLVGSPPYMSPEQWGGGTLEPTSDIYSLGCVMFRYFAGKPYIDATTVSEALTAHATMESQQRLKEINCGEHTDKIRTMIGNALQYNPLDRYQTAAELAEDLRTIQNGGSVKSRTPVQGKRLNMMALSGETERKTSTGFLEKLHLSPAKLIALSAFLCLVIGFGAFAGWTAWKKKSVRDAACSEVSVTYDSLIRRATNPNLILSVESKHPEKLKEAAQQFLQKAETYGSNSIDLQQRIVAEWQIARADRILGNDEDAYRRLQKIIPLFANLKHSDLPKESHGDEILLSIVNTETAHLDLAAVCLRSKTHYAECEKACLWLIKHPYESCSMPKRFRPRYDVPVESRCLLVLLYKRMGKLAESKKAFDDLTDYLMQHQNVKSRTDAEEQARQDCKQCDTGVDSPRLAPAFWLNMRNRFFGS